MLEGVYPSFVLDLILTAFLACCSFRNIIHGSDAVESAQKEIALWFPSGVAHYATALAPWIYEKP